MKKSAKEKKHYPKYGILLAAAALVVVASVSSAAVAGVSLKELVAVKLANLLHGDLRSELLSGEEVDVLGAGVGQGRIENNTGELRDNLQVVSNFNEIGLLPSTSTPRMVVHLGAEVGSIGAGSSTFMVLRNMLAQTVYVTRCGIHLNGTTSSTTRFSMGTSSTAGGLDWNTTTEARNCLNRVLAATSTVSYGNANGLFGGGGVPQPSLGGVGNSTSTLLELKTGEYLVGFMTTGGSNAIHGSSATSVAGRGFDANSFWEVEYRLFSTGTRRD